MKKDFVLFTVLLAAVVLSSCKKEEDRTNYYEQEYPPTAIVIKQAVTDYDGNIYDAVQIGNQIWMASNLRTKHYADGTEVVNWDGYTFHIVYNYPAFGWCDTPLPVNAYGYRYSWEAALRGDDFNNYNFEENPHRVQGICPNGWHVPSAKEFEQLCSTINNQSLSSHAHIGENLYHDETTSIIVGKALASSQDWEPSDQQYAIGNNLNSNNSTGFSALPCRDDASSCVVIDGTDFITCSEQTIGSSYENQRTWPMFFRIMNEKGIGFDYISGCSGWGTYHSCVRCVKD